MKKEILKLTGLTEAEFYKMYPTPDAFASAYPGYKKKLGGLTEAFPQIATADNFFSYGVPVPPTYYMSGGPVYPQIQTEAQFFSPVYSNSNNAYAKGGSYMEAYPQAVSYPSHGMGYSNYFMLADGGSMTPEMNAMASMGTLPQLQSGSNLFDKTMDSVNHYYGQYPMEDGGSTPNEPSSDQTFYTQKNNNFFDKLRKASYKSLLKEGMESYSPYPTDAQEFAYGGLTEFQPGGNYTYHTAADGTRYLVGENGQLYSPAKGNQNTQQTTYVNSPYYSGRGIVNFLTPNDKVSWRNIREQQGKGIGDLTPERLEAIKSGAANVADITYETRKAILPKNRVKKVNIKFKTPVAGQQTTTQDSTASTTTPSSTTTTSTATTPGTTTSPATNPTATTTQPSTASTQQPTTTTTATSAAPKDVELDDGSYVTEEEAKAKGYTKDPSGNWKSPAKKSTQADVNATVAKMQAEARAKGMDTASFESPYSDEDLMPADERTRMQTEANAVSAEFQNYENYKKYRKLQERAGMTPDEYNYNQVYDYSSKAASPKGTVDYTPKQNTMSSTASPTTTTTRQAPSNANSMDANVAAKKAAMRNPNVNQAFIDAMTGQNSASGVPYRTAVGPVIETNEQTGATYRLGGPYVLPMYQGATGPSQVDEPFGPYAEGIGMDPNQSPYGPYADEYKFGPIDDEFELGYDVSRVKNFDPRFSDKVYRTADFINRYKEADIADNHISQESRANQVFGNMNIRPQDTGNYVTNQPVGINFRPNAQVPVQATGFNVAAYGGNFPFMYDTANLYFLTPQMLKKTRKIS